MSLLSWSPTTAPRFLAPAKTTFTAALRTLPASSANPLPWPKKAKGTLSSQAQEEVQNSQFAAKAVEPHSTQSGFMFFDVSGISTPLAGASFYLTGVLDAKGNELMYFEIPLEKYLTAPSR